jgi:hypothetical protein
VSITFTTSVMSAFVASLTPASIEAFKHLHGTQNLQQLKNKLLEQLFGISNELNCPVWMDCNGTIRKCANAAEFNRMKRIHAEFNP